MLSHPLPDECLDNIDQIVEYKNGHIDLNIISYGFLDNSEFTMEKLTAKINTYLDALETPDFQEDFGKRTAENTTIKLIYKPEPHPDIIALLENIQNMVKNYGATLKWEHL